MSLNKLKHFKKPWVIGLIVGIILAIGNILLAGIPGIILFENTLDPVQSISGCAGEDCWGPSALYGSVIFLIVGFLFGYLVGIFINRSLSKVDKDKF